MLKTEKKMNFFSHTRKKHGEKKKQKILKFGDKNRLFKEEQTSPKKQDILHYSLKTCVFIFFYVQ